MKIVTVWATYRWSHEQESLVGKTSHEISPDIPAEALGEILTSHMQMLREAHNELRFDELQFHFQTEG